jgi:hypothetical protein
VQRRRPFVVNHPARFEPKIRRNQGKSVPFASSYINVAHSSKTAPISPKTLKGRATIVATWIIPLGRCFINYNYPHFAPDAGRAPPQPCDRSMRFAICAG